MKSIISILVNFQIIGIITKKLVLKIKYYLRYRNLHINPDICHINGEFTTTTEIEFLLKTQKILTDNLDYYFHKENQRLAYLKKYLDEFRSEQKQAKRDDHMCLSNPINIFIFIKSLTMDLDHIADNMVLKVEYLMNFTMREKSLVYPTQNDLEAAAAAIARLRTTYKLDVKELAEGKLKGAVYGLPMSSDDCYELGRLLFKMADYVNECAFMIEAFHKFGKENDQYKFTEVDILEYIIFAYFSLGDMKNALKWTYTLLDVDPNNSRAQHNLLLYSERIALENSNFEKETNEEITQESEILEDYAKVEKAYEAQCRGEVITPIQIHSRLTCGYLSDNHAFLKIAPIKMEMMNINPDVVLFRDVLSENEIETLKQIATPKFERAKASETDPEILAKVSHLIDKDSNIVARISRRVADMTGLDVKYSENLKVVNYEIGGHYEIHYDTPSHKYNTSKCPENDKNRIATVMFYMSEVPLGGATVFTKLGLNVYPSKGAALFWYNMYASGERNLDMMHASCPVLLGSKWVCTKWINHCGQEFYKPCDLVYQRETTSTGFVLLDRITIA